MSIKLMSAIFMKEFNDLKDEGGNITKASTAKFILLALADHTNDDGEGAYPSINTLALKTSLTRRCVISAIDALKYNNLLKLEGISKRGTNNYTVNVGAFIPSESSSPPSEPDSPPSESSSPGEVNPLHPIHPLTTQEPLTPLEMDQANAMVTDIISGSQNTDKNWEGRDLFRQEHFAYVDWYHGVTGQVCPRKKSKDWWLAVGTWKANQLTIEDLQAAYDTDIKWRGVFTSPNELTNKAIALKAQRSVKVEKTPVTVEATIKKLADQWDGKKFVPRPAHVPPPRIKR